MHVDRRRRRRSKDRFVIIAGGGFLFRSRNNGRKWATFRLQLFHLALEFGVALLQLVNGFLQILQSFSVGLRRVGRVQRR